MVITTHLPCITSFVMLICVYRSLDIIISTQTQNTLTKSPLSHLILFGGYGMADRGNSAVCLFKTVPAVASLPATLYVENSAYSNKIHTTILA